MEITKRLRAVNVLFTFLPLEIAPVPSDSIASPRILKVKKQKKIYYDNISRQSESTSRSS